jgi:mannose-1-phosphate guanylyltransferase/mannose-6-phosphate isomerase
MVVLDGGNNMISVILAGGKGLRLWPVSRQSHPKQLCKFIKNKTMLEHTIDRLVQIGTDHIIIITSEELQNDIEKIVLQRNDDVFIEILTEPEGKNTAAAVGMALARTITKEKDEIIGVFPADHHILNNTAFKASIAKALEAAAQDQIVTIGVTPDRPETGYGYIEKSRYEFGEIPGVYSVKSFCEKPDLPTAELYFENGSHIWNAGIYIGKTRVLCEEFAEYLPEIYQHLIKGYTAYKNAYPKLPNISLDYGIAEKSQRMTVVPGDFGWCDLGSWNALAELYQCDEQSNTCTGEDIIVMDSSNCLVKQEDKSLVLYGVNDLLVVETDDVILISDRNRSQDVRQIVDLLAQQNREDLL